MKSIGLWLFLILVGSLFSYIQLGAQQISETYSLNITEFDLNQFNGRLEVKIVALKQGEPVEISPENLIFYEVKDERKQKLEIDLIEEIEPEEKDQLTVLFLIDLSGSMKGEKFAAAKRAVEITIKRSNLPPGTAFFLATFDDDISDNIPFTRETIDSVLNSIEVSNKDTDLFTAIMVKVTDLNRLDGKKAMILLSDGKHDIANNPRYRNGVIPVPKQNEVFNTLDHINQDVLIFSIGLGEEADTNFLKAVVDSTINKMDVYSFSSTPAKLDSIFYNVITGLSGNYRITLTNNVLPYNGDERTLLVSWIPDRGTDQEKLAGDQISYREGTINYPIPAPPNRSIWPRLFLFGLSFLLLVFALLSLLVPVLKRREFRKKYVVTYVRKDNRVFYDTVTNEPIEEGTLVVNKCHQLIPLQVWEGVGEKCPHFPDCIHSLGCNGAGAQEVSASFFSQKGDLKKLNWLWFGGIGGFLGWIMYALYRGRIINFDWHEKIVGTFLDQMQMTQSASGIANETYVGVCVGLGLAATLTIVEQLNHLQRFSPLPLLFKMVLGALVGGLTFFSGSILQPDIISSSFISGLLTWLVFGLCFGFILSINSFVSLKRALLAAPLASGLSFLIYYVGFFGGWGNTETIETIRLFSLIILGAIIGFVIVTVITSLEEYELEFMSPDHFRGHTVPISKWISQGMKITVGISPKCQVFIKWADEAVLDKHAHFSQQESNIYIEPVGDVLVNDRFIGKNKKTALKNMDIIQLGRYSITKIRYKEKRIRSEPEESSGPAHIGKSSKQATGKQW